MGKNHKHKKILKSEKAKTKLRVKSEKTKFLPKGLNVTKTEFKVKAIVLPEQLKAHGSDELLSRRKLNIKDILSRLKHHSTSAKQDSCEELKQLLSVHIVEIVEQHLSQILLAVSPLLLDIEKKIRRSAIKVLEIILSQTPVETIEPFFPILSSFLRCSMTNINRAVQEDSLLFLDSVLKHCATLAAQNKDKILPNLFALISKLRSDAKPGRTLTVDLGSKITNVKWRIQVLSRLYAFLSAVHEDREFKPNIEKDGGFVKLANDSNRIPLLVDPYHKNIIFIGSDAQEGSGEDVVIKNLRTLTSLLYEIWLEVAPNKSLNQAPGDSVILPYDTTTVLVCILNIFQLLFQHVESQSDPQLKSEFLTKDYENFMRNVLMHFPFSTQQTSKGKDSELQDILKFTPDQKCVRENLIVCYLFCKTVKNLSHRITDANNILSYLTRCVVNRNYVSETNVGYLMNNIKIIFGENLSNWSKHVDIGEFLRKLLQFFSPSKKCLNDDVFKVLCHTSEVPSLNRLPSYQRWLSELSALLCYDKISVEILSTLLLLAKQRNMLFLEQLKININPILSNFNNIRIIDGGANEAREKLKILHLYYYTPKLNAEEIDALKDLLGSCDDGVKSSVKYIIDKHQ